jgi:hypothetical protein
LPGNPPNAGANLIEQTGKLAHGFFEFSASRSFFKRAKADSKASWLFQLEKPGQGQSG